MSRFGKGHSYGHRVRQIDRDCYRVSWVVDRYYPDSRLRHPRGTSRDTDETSARRFAKRWKCSFPGASPNNRGE